MEDCKISIDSNNLVTISKNNIIIVLNDDSVIFNKAGYQVRETAEHLEFLLSLDLKTDWEKKLLKEDISTLKNLSDTYIFKSLSSNEIISKSNDIEAFNNICENIISICSENI